MDTTKENVERAAKLIAGLGWCGADAAEILIALLAERDAALADAALLAGAVRKLNTGVFDLTAQHDALKALCDRLKLEAQMHAQEARTANSTIAKIYQVCSGSTGEHGNWHGAEPVRQCVERLKALVVEACNKLEAEKLHGSGYYNENDAEQQNKSIDEFIARARTLSTNQ